ncbi:MAG: hypothetical protein KDE08_06950 [Rhodobacteraceae bacterium]|nr:hypothetical protein [Paracoccaceae bacterium]
MPHLITTYLDRLLFRRSLAWWRRAASRAEASDTSVLRRLRGPARQLRREIDRLLHVADGRLMLPAIGTNAIRKPLHADWAWRPELWRGPVTPPGMAAVDNRAAFGSEATVFHDCARSELTVRQVRNSRESDLAPFGFRMDVFRFDGSFLSLVIDLPEAAVQGLKLRHVIRMDVIVELEKPLEIFARLNIKHGPNAEQMVRELPLGESEVMVEFDLAYSKMNEKRVERAWVDLIFEGPEMNQITLRDVTFTRRPRAEL